MGLGLGWPVWKDTQEGEGQNLQLTAWGLVRRKQSG